MKNKKAAALNPIRINLRAVLMASSGSHSRTDQFFNCKNWVIDLPSS